MRSPSQLLPALLCLVLSLFPFLVKSQSNSDINNNPQQVFESNEMVILTPQQQEKYFNAFWFRYSTMNRQSDIDKVAPHFPKPDNSISIDSQRDRYNESVEKWMNHYQDELIAFEKVFNPDMIFRHGPVGSSRVN